MKRCSFSELDAEWSGRVQLDDSFRVTPKMMPRSSGQNHEGSSRKRLGVRGIGVLAECHAGLAGNDCEKLVSSVLMCGYFVAGRELETNGKRPFLREIAI